MSKKHNDILIVKYFGVIFGFLVGCFVSFIYNNSKMYSLNYIPPAAVLQPVIDRVHSGDIPRENGSPSNNTRNFWVDTNPRGAERLPPGIVVSETDFYLRRLTGDPSEDVPKKEKYLVTFTVGYDQKENIEASIKKFNDDFTILLFHYDGRINEWDEFEWSKRAIHVSAPEQTKWWFAKRFLHPDVVAAYDYIFIWDEDLGVEHFNAEKYIEMVKKHGLEISQPGLEANGGLTWEMTKRRGGSEVHMKTKEKAGWCTDPLLPPCAAFVEIMAPVFSHKAWRCVWYMIQNDLVHGWGLDYALRKCVHPDHEKIGVVDSQWINHKRIPTLKTQVAKEGVPSGGGVRDRCKKEWEMFKDRLRQAEEEQLLLLESGPGRLVESMSPHNQTG